MTLGTASGRASRRRALLRGGAGLFALFVVGAASGGAWLQARLRASLPLLAGERALPGLSASVRVERDSHGVPVVRGESRLDVARVTGYLHAQERFFQMDLLRRRAAGELAELFGEAALEVDREARVLRLRTVARQASARLADDGRALLEAYSAGVNAGLSALEGDPFEYLLLRVSPRGWETEDSLLCALAMFLTLQGRLAAQESSLGLMHDLLPPELFEFLAPLGTEWDAPVEGEPFVQPAVPAPAVVDLRRLSPRLDAPREPLARGTPFDPLGLAGGDAAIVLGSNSWAVAGARTAHGGALLANDMHLGISVPNTWYRAALVFPFAGEPRRVVGVMLPGAPFVVAGSNGRVAWGFTNSQGDWADLVELELDPDDPERYLTPDGPLPFETVTETIGVKGRGAEEIRIRTTVFGPVVDEDHRGRSRALAWVPLRDGGLNASFFRMEQVDDVEAALALAPEVGIPHQNLVCADAGGHIGWTIIGRIPRRVGFSGRLPASWADGTRRWDGWLAPGEYPRVVDPPSGRLWTANARVVSGAALEVIGFGGYDLGARARQIRDDLAALDRATEADMLAVQLDDRAVFLRRWRDLLLEILTPDATAADARRAEARRLVDSWEGRASVGSAGYRLVRLFREQVARDAFSPLLAPVREADERLDYTGRRPDSGHRQWEGPLWALVSERPLHLLDPRFSRWEALLLASLDRVIDDLTGEGGRLADRTWGEHNTTLIRHPLSRALPALGRWLDMPKRPLPGDSHMPRVQHPTAGASERLVVSPAREEQGYFHMPCGQSGHPLSPHYRDGHEHWALGAPTPLLPGEAAHVLVLRPKS